MCNRLCTLKVFVCFSFLTYYHITLWSVLCSTTCSFLLAYFPQYWSIDLLENKHTLNTKKHLKCQARVRLYARNECIPFNLCAPNHHNQVNDLGWDVCERMNKSRRPTPEMASGTVTFVRASKHYHTHFNWKRNFGPIKRRIAPHTHAVSAADGLQRDCISFGCETHKAEARF